MLQASGRPEAHRHEELVGQLHPCPDAVGVVPFPELAAIDQESGRGMPEFAPEREGRDLLDPVPMRPDEILVPRPMEVCFEGEEEDPVLIDLALLEGTEAARIEGLSIFGVFLKIILPLTKPALATLIILAFTGTWNSYLIPTTFINRESMYTLVQGLNAAKDQFFDRVNVTMSGVVLTTIPVIIVFLIFQKYYIQGVASAGLKG